MAFDQNKVAGRPKGDALIFPPSRVAFAVRFIASWVFLAFAARARGLFRPLAGKFMVFSTQKGVPNKTGMVSEILLLRGAGRKRGTYFQGAGLRPGGMVQLNPKNRSYEPEKSGKTAR